MRVDNPDNFNHDHSFGVGAHEADVQQVGLGGQEHLDSSGTHGIFDQIGHGATPVAEHFGGHVEVGHLGDDFGQHHDGLDGLHDSVHSIGLGFSGDEHHSLHDGLHDTHHDLQHDAGHHDVGVDVHHDHGSTADFFHHG